jgi:hypothetical protein
MALERLNRTSALVLDRIRRDRDDGERANLAYEG